MDKKKLIITIVCGVAALALVCVVLVGLISGQWPWQNNDWAADYTGMPSHGETNATDDSTTPDDTTGAGDATVDVAGPTIGVEIEDPNTGSSGSGSSGNGGSGSGGSGNGGNSGGNKTEIDFDDLLGKDDDDKKPTTGGNSGSTAKPTEPETTEPETTPETTTPSTTAPDSDDDGNGGEKPEDTDIDVPIE